MTCGRDVRDSSNDDRLRQCGTTTQRPLVIGERPFVTRERPRQSSQVVTPPWPGDFFCALERKVFYIRYKKNLKST